MILKAGTYRFNDVLSAIANGRYYVNFLSNNYEYSYIFISQDPTMCYRGDNDEADDLYDFNLGVWTQDDVWKTITITQDTEVDDTFGTWYIANTNYNEVNAPPLAEITYNGETIAQLNAGETATLSCEGKKMVSDVVVKVNKVEEPKDDSIGGVWKFNNTITPPNNISQLLLIFVCESDDGCGQGFNKIIFNYEGGEFKSMSLRTMAGADYEMYRVKGGWGMNTTIYVTPSCEYTSDTLDILKAIATKQ